MPTAKTEKTQAKKPLGEAKQQAPGQKRVTRSTATAPPAIAVHQRKGIPAPPKKPKDKENADPKKELENLTRKQLQKKAIEMGIKANGKSEDILKALQALEANASKGFDAFMKPIKIENKWDALPNVTAAEKEELADLDFLGIRGCTPGGRKYRSKISAEEKRRLSEVPHMAPIGEAEVEVA
jgi:hypothetical protein